MDMFNTGTLYTACACFKHVISISIAPPPLGDYVPVHVIVVLKEEMLLKIKSSHEIC